MATQRKMFSENLSDNANKLWMIITLYQLGHKEVNHAWPNVNRIQKWG